LAVFCGFLTRYEKGPDAASGQRIARVQLHRLVDLAASGAANIPEKLTHGQRPAGRGRFSNVSGWRGAARLTGIKRDLTASGRA